MTRHCRPKFQHYIFPSSISELIFAIFFGFPRRQKSDVSHLRTRKAVPACDVQIAFVQHAISHFAIRSACRRQRALVCTIADTNFGTFVFLPKVPNFGPKISKSAIWTLFVFFFLYREKKERNARIRKKKGGPKVAYRTKQELWGFSP